AEVLGIKEEKIGIENNFFQLGGQSLKAVVFIAKIHKQLKIKLPLAEVFKTPTIKGLARYIKKAGEETFISIEPVEKKEYYPLTPAQKRLYILQQMTPKDTVYNITKTVEMSEEPDGAHLEETFNKLLQRHESLRTSFQMIENTPVQRVHDTVAFAIEYYDLTRPGAMPHEVSIKDFVRPFDLSAAPLLRAGLVKSRNASWVLIVDLHHIISDGVSQGVLTRDFMSLYRVEELPALKLQYKDYAHWQDGDKEREALKGRENYWLKEFAGTIPVLTMPIDFARPMLQSFSGAILDFEVGMEETAALNRVMIKEGVTMYMVWLAIYNVFLAKISGQEDIITGTPVAGRRHIDMQQIIGMFVNTLAIRNFPRGEHTFKEFLKEVKEKTLQAFENQEYPFEDLVEKVVTQRDTGRNPLFDVMFAFQDIESMAGNTMQQQEPGENENRPHSLESANTGRLGTSKFDFTLIIVPSQDRFSFVVEYCTKLFKASTIHAFISYFKTIISRVVENPGIRLGQIEIISQAEKQQILEVFNHSEIEYPTAKNIAQLFQEQVERTPHAVALIGKEPAHAAHAAQTETLSLIFLTYEQLNEKARGAAGVLEQKNVAPGSPVGIMVERSPEMIVGILGILKAGCGYVPLNPKAPASRTDYMLTECGVDILLTTHSLFEKEDKGNKVSKWQGETILLESIVDHSNSLSPLHHSSFILYPSNHPAYVIFTSGSTGRPKGVAITHANLSPLLHWGYHQLGLGPKDRTLQNLAYYFDWSVWEIFITLTSGASLWTLPDEIVLEPETCVSFINRHEITVLHATPTQYRYLTGTHAGARAPRNPETMSLRYLFIGAEKLSFGLVERSFDLVNRDCRVFNMYGPTEATIISAVLEIDRTGFKSTENRLSVPIGRAVGNGLLLVLDRYLNLCPVNMTGELYIGGDGVAMGYLNNPELTAEKFIKIHPYHSILYRTGDLVRWLPDGNVEFFGRIDQQVKIRGQRIELGEIENQLLQHGLVKETVVLAKENENGEPYLCAYIVLHHGDTDDAGNTPEPLPYSTYAAVLKEYLSHSLPDYMIPSYIIPLEKIPLTANGKLDINALPAAKTGAGAGEKYAAPTDEIERTLVRLWGEVLNHRHPVKIGIDDNFFELGGHSLKATILASRVHKELDARLPLAEIFRLPTIRELAEFIKEAVGVRYERYADIEPVEKKDFYVLAPAQKRLYVIDQMVPHSTAYNMPEVFSMPGEPDL
ncbi:MAG TPA: amino acid adenylation domain-containing protein, partial [Candidatus Deferrimicrobium sp.]|nr:amino acid adenylation domain-containing protein [Candidatus Deferrimicrobium sp.]